MGLIKCPDCNKMFSDRIDACPECGCPTIEALKENDKRKQNDNKEEVKIEKTKAKDKNENKFEINKEDLMSSKELKEFALNNILPILKKEIDIKDIKKGDSNKDDVDLYIITSSEKIGIDLFVEVAPNQRSYIYNENHAKLMSLKGYKYAIAQIGIGACDPIKFERRRVFKNDEYYFNYEKLKYFDYEKISKNWHKYIPQRFSDGIQMLLRDLDRNMNAYFRGQALVAGIVGILFAIGFQIIGLPMGIGIGLFIGVLNLVPYMQALGIPPCILLGLIQSAETGRPVWVVMLCIAAVFIIVQSIQDMVLVPKIMGDVTGMGPAWILLSLSIWGSLLGFVGMIIALPVTTLFISYYKRFVLHMTDDMTRPLPRSSWNIPFLKRRK